MFVVCFALSGLCSTYINEGKAFHTLSHISHEEYLWPVGQRYDLQNPWAPFQYKDDMILLASELQNGIFCTDKMTSSYWITAQALYITRSSTWMASSIWGWQGHFFCDGEFTDIMPFCGNKILSCSLVLSFLCVFSWLYTSRPCHLNTVVNWVITVLDIGLLLVKPQAATWTNAESLSIEMSGIKQF